jgi:hypothetical protein
MKAPSVIMNSDPSVQVRPAITKYNSKFKEIKTTAITTNNEKAQYRSTFFLGGNYYGLTSVVERSSKKEKFYTCNFDNNLENTNVDMLVWETSINMMDTSGFQFAISPDSTRYLISYLEFKGGSNPASLSLGSFDKSMKNIINKVETFKVPKKQLIIEDLHIDNSGNTFFLVKEYNKPTAKEEIKNSAGEKIPDYKVYVLAYTVDGNSNKYEPDFKGQFLMRGKFNSKANGTLQLFAGLSKESDKGIQSFSYIEFDTKSGKEITNSHTEISSSFSERIDQLENDKPGTKNAAVAGEFKVTEFLNINEGSSFVILEKNDTYEGSYTSEGIIVTKISDSKIQWMNFIPKLHSSRGFNEFISHKAILTQNGISIIYNEVDNNKDYDIVNAAKGPVRHNKMKDLYLMKADFDNSGKIIGSILLNPEETNTSIDIKHTAQGKNRIILCGMKVSGLTSRVGKFGLMGVE